MSESIESMFEHSREHSLDALKIGRSTAAMHIQKFANNRGYYLAVPMHILDEL